MIKFRYAYSNGKEIKSFIYTIEEIEIGNFIGIKTSLEKQGFELISRDRLVGLKDKNKVEVFENDKISDISGYVYHIIWDSPEARFGASIIHGDKIYVLNEDEVEKCEIISNTHIEKLKETND